MTEELTIQDHRTVYIAYTNTDLTEGRGFQYPLAISESMATVKRLGKGKSVQGCDCDCRIGTAVKINNQWLAPFRLITPSKEDLLEDKKTHERLDIIDRMKSCGFSTEEINKVR